MQSAFYAPGLGVVEGSFAVLVNGVDVHPRAHKELGQSSVPFHDSTVKGAPQALALRVHVPQRSRGIWPPQAALHGQPPQGPSTRATHGASAYVLYYFLGVGSGHALVQLNWGHRV